MNVSCDALVYMKSKVLLTFSIAVALRKELSCKMKCLCHFGFVFICTCVFETLTKFFDGTFLQKSTLKINFLPSNV